MTVPVTSPAPAARGAFGRADFGLTVGGREADAVLRLDVLALDVAEEVGRHGRASLLLSNWDPDTRAVRWSDDEHLAPGTAVTLSLGWSGELVPVFSGVVTAVTGHFPAGSAPTLEVTCRSRSTWLAGIARSRAYADVTDGDVVGDLAAAYGLTADTEAGASQPTVAWAGTCDWDHLVDRAARLGWVTYVRDTTLVFRPPAPPAADVPVLSFATTLQELQVTQDLAGLPDSVTVRAWSEDLEARTSTARTDLPTTDWPLRAAEVGTSARWGADEVEAVAAARAGAARARSRSGRGTTLGLPGLRCDSWLQLDGVGARLGGRHYVSAVRHRLTTRSGFTTEFQLGAPPATLPPPERPHRGGLEVAVVDELDGDARVKVRFPQLGAADAVWARLAVLDAGPEQGTLFVPDVGQEVVVGWLDDDRRSPVVLGALWNAQQRPPQQVGDGNPVRAVVTRSGHRLVFDDAGPGSVTLRSAAGAEVVVDDAAGELRLREKDGAATVVLGADGVAVEATTGDILLSAPAGKVVVEALELALSATGPATLTSSATLEVSAGATLTASGALVRIN